MWKFLGLSLWVATSLSANRCEDVALYYAKQLISTHESFADDPLFQEQLKAAVQKKLKGLLSDIRNAQEDGNLTIENAVYFEDVNWTILMIGSYAKKYGIADLLEGIKEVGIIYPVFLENPCAR